VVVQPTDRALVSLPAADFYADILRGRLRARAIVEGTDFRFGASRIGDIKLLETLCSHDGVTLETVPAVMADGQPVSSFVGAQPESAIRAFLAKLIPDPSELELRHARAAMAAGQATLYVPQANRIGLVIDAASEATLELALNLANAARAVHGIEIVAHAVARTPIGARCVRTVNGAYVGDLDDAGPLMEACERVVKAGATAIAIASIIHDLPPDLYDRHFAGEHPNPVGGAEAVLSHLVARMFRLPTAHAPLLNHVGDGRGVVDARAGGEAASVSGLMSVLIGLRRAPQFDPDTPCRVTDALTHHNVVAVVAPATALGSWPVLEAERRGVPVIAVEGNPTILNVTAARLGLTRAWPARSYAEAAGLVMALRQGLSLESVCRPLLPLAAAAQPV
jgi:hypothetical protein